MVKDFVITNAFAGFKGCESFGLLIQPTAELHGLKKDGIQKGVKGDYNQRSSFR